MSTSAALFNKELDGLSYKDIKNYFVIEREETNKIEFKSYSGKGKEGDQFISIYKTICSFLNSDGGILIWGSPQETKRNKKTYCQGELMPVTREYSKDFLINKITDNIDPVQNFVNIQVLNNGSDYLYLFEINKGITSYHFDHICWIRLDGQKRKAPYYIVHALMNQIRYPELVARLKIKNCEAIIDNESYNIGFVILILNKSKAINEHNLVIRFQTDIGFLKDISLNGNYSRNKSIYLCENAIGVLHFGHPYAIRFNIEIPMETVYKAKFSNFVTVYFGGKYSPLKLCSMELNLNKFKSDDPFQMVGEYHENHAMNETLGEGIIEKLLNTL